MFNQGLTLTIIGMSIVFVFLTLLVILMSIMSRIVRNVESRRSAKQTDNIQAAAESVETEHGEAEKGEAGQTEEPAGEDHGEIAAALGAYLRDGGVLPGASGDGREDVAAVLAAMAASGAPVPKGNDNEIAAAIAAVRAYNKQ